MLGNRSFIQKISDKRTLFLQLLFVTLAFLMMVVSSSIFVNTILRNHLLRDETNMLSQTKLKVEAEFIEPQTAIIAISEIIRSMIMNGSGDDEVLATMKYLSREFQQQTGGLAFDSLCGYFESFGGLFLHSEGGEWEENYDSIDHPWQTVVVEDGNENTISPVFINVCLEDFRVTFKRRLFDNEGKPLGMVYLNMPLDRIRDHVLNMQIAEGGYGVLLDDMNDVITHPRSEFVGKPASQISPGFSLIVEELESGNDLLELEIENYLSQWSVASTMRLDNGWVLILMTPKAVYYREMQNMMLVISILGASFALALIIILLRFDLAKTKSDEQNRRKDALLTDMEKQHEADERTQLMLDATPLGCKLWDRDLHIIECNQEVLHLFGLQDKQEFFDRFFELSPEIQPDGRPSKEKAAEFIKKAFDEGYNYLEWMHQKLNGEEIPAEITLVRVKHKGDYAVAGYIRDLRDYKQMMRKIEQRDKLLNTVNHTAGMLLAIEDDKNVIDSILKSMELMGRSVDVDRVQIWQNEIADGVYNFILKYEWLSEVGLQKNPVSIGAILPYSRIPAWTNKFLRGEYVNSQFSELSASDQEFWDSFEIKSMVMVPLFLRDRFWGIFCLEDCRNEHIFSEEEINILRSGGLLIANAFLRNDMMQNIRSGAAQLAKALREAQDANTAKSKFLASMSHEIRTPMNVVLGVAESQLFTEINPQKAKEAFEKIFDSGNWLLRIINDILDLSKIEADKFELNPANYEALSLINDAVNMNVMQFGHKLIEFKLEVDENIPLYLYGDELRIKQVLNNLLTNAFKYTNVGEVKLSLSATETDENKTVLLIRVSDTGQGMTGDQVNKLFDEYTRFNLEANRSTVGTGLGMTITSNLIKMMGGTIDVDSTPGVGTTFTVSIPQRITEPGVVLGKNAIENLERFNFSNRQREKITKIVRELMPYGKVLVVDDMKSNLDVAKLLLNPYQLQIDTASSGFEAIDIIKTGKVYDIIFMDHMMPEMDGIETVKKIRQSGYCHPIFALTADAIAGQKDLFLAKGFDGYISKPIDIRELNDSLNKFVRDKEHGRQEGQVLPAGLPSADHEKAAIEIPGVETEKGLALYNGDIDIFVTVLRSYVANTLSVIEKMRNVSEESLANYAVSAHGLKGISAGIGAEKIKNAALDLEMKAKSGDLAGVLSGNNDLLEDTEFLVRDIQAWLREMDGQKPKPRLECPDRFLLDRLRKSCEAYDMKGIDAVMDELESASYDKDASLVDWLREKIDSSDFSIVAERLLEYGVKPE